MLEYLEKGTIILPTAPTPTIQDDGTITKTDEIIFNKEYDRYTSLRYTFENELKQVYSLYYCQDDDDMKATLAEDPKFDNINKSKDVLGLYKLLQSANFSYTNNKEPIMAMWKVIADFVKIKQQKGQTVNDYYERFKTMYEVNKSLSTSIYDHLGMGAIIAPEKNINLNAMTPEKKDTWETDTMIEARDCMMAVHFLMGADQDVYGSLVQNLKNLYLMNSKNE